jgi:hypothetical protein
MTAGNLDRPARITDFMDNDIHYVASENILDLDAELFWSFGSGRDGRDAECRHAEVGPYQPT